MKPFLILVLLFNASYLKSYSQVVKGKIYDKESTVKGIKVFNKNNNTLSYSNEDGYFSIGANVNDTLTFNSIFYNEKSVKLKQHHFNEIIVIELTKIVNELNEVLLTDIGNEKPFDENSYSNNLSEQMKNDLKNNPHLYSKIPNGGIDFVKLFSLMSNFLKKRKTKEQIHYVSYKDLDSLFKSKSIFNDKLLSTDLKIKPEYKILFFDYCELKHINKTLLTQKKELELLNRLFIYSQEFILFTEEHTEKP